jgi:hypothetical protein
MILSRSPTEKCRSSLSRTASAKYRLYTVSDTAATDWASAEKSREIPGVLEAKDVVAFTFPGSVPGQQRRQYLLEFFAARQTATSPMRSAGRGRAPGPWPISLRLPPFLAPNA